MKKIILYADTNDKNATNTAISAETYSLVKFFDAKDTINTTNPNFVLIDADFYKQPQELIHRYKNEGAKVWAYSSDFSRKNILELYAKKFDNVIERPTDFDQTFRTITNPLNNDDTELFAIKQIKDLQNALFKENKLIDSLIKYLPKQAIITTENFTVLLAGTQFFPIFRNENFFEALRQENIELPQEEIKKIIDNKQIKYCFTIPHNNKFYKIEFTKIFDKTLRLGYYLIHIEDCTEKILLEEQKETFIATITHDLKAPIRAEETILQQLIDGKFGNLNTTQIEILKEILNSRKTTKRMVDNLLSRHKICSNQFCIEPEVINYQETVFNAIKSAVYLIEAKEQTLITSYNAKTKNLYCDKTAINRVLINLIANASEYTPKKGQITIMVSETPNQIITEIKDTGYGIEEKDLTHIFDKHVTFAKKYRKVGSGLGLYISKSLIDALGGTITVQSKPKKGTTFTFALNKQPKRVSTQELQLNTKN